MRKRKFRDIELSQLGFGLMRLPVLDGDESKIDVHEADRMLHEAFDAGVNYFDTAWPYHSGRSENFAGEFLKKSGLRDRLYLATKLPCWLCESYEDFDRYLSMQLERLGTDHIDFYLLHAMDGQRLTKMIELGFGRFLDEAKRDGRIRYAGFSFHDDYSAFEDVLHSYDFDFCQIQFNYMDEEFQAGLRGLKKAAKMGLGVMIMEPLKGGQLAKKPEGDLKELWDSFDTDETPAELGLRWVLDHPEVTVTLSGMSSPEQVSENLRTARSAGPGELTDKEVLQRTHSRPMYRLQILHRLSPGHPDREYLQILERSPPVRNRRFRQETLPREHQTGKPSRSMHRVRKLRSTLSPEDPCDRNAQTGPRISERRFLTIPELL